MGFDTRRLIVVRPWRDVDLLWTMEEGLRSGALAAVLRDTATMQSVVLRCAATPRGIWWFFRLPGNFLDIGVA